MACVLALMLAGCATTSQPPRSQQLSAEQQHTLLQQLDVFSFSGRVAVAAAAQGFTSSVVWRQQRDGARVKLAGPLGVGSLQIHYSPQQLSLVSSQGVKFMNAEAEQVLARELGFVPPFEALRYWMLGVPAPGLEAAIETQDAAGFLQQLEQQDWLIRYERRVTVKTAAGELLLPAKLVATRADTRLRLVIDRWKFK